MVGLLYHHPHYSATSLFFNYNRRVIFTTINVATIRQKQGSNHLPRNFATIDGDANLSSSD